MANYRENEDDFIQAIDNSLHEEMHDPVDDFLSQMRIQAETEEPTRVFQPITQPQVNAARIPQTGAQPYRAAAQQPYGTSVQHSAQKPNAPGQVRVYNRDYVNQKRRRHAEPAQNRQPEPPRRESPVAAPPRKKKRRHVVLPVVLTILLVLVVSTVALWFLYPKRPDGAAAAGKQGDVSTILVCGTDQEGYRTDTMMLLYLNNDTKQANLLSIPRDTRVVVDGESMKLNAVYGYGGQGKKGMRLLLEEMGDILGYEPDAYVLLHFTELEDVIDTMGGIEFDVPCDMYYDDPAQDLHIDLSEGMQTLSGKEAVQVLRYRSGYALADLERVNVQRDMVKAALEQWLKPSKLLRGIRSLGKLSDGTETNMNSRNLFWIAKSVYHIGLGSMESYTLPGSWDSPYYWLDTEQCAQILNEYFNPTDGKITADDLGG